MLLLDKGYFDYDFEKVGKKAERVDWKDTIRSDEETRKLLAGFGIGVPKPKKPETVEDIQNYILKEENHGS